MFTWIILQLPVVCPGVSTNARRESQTSTATPHRVPAIDINHMSPFNIAHAVPLHPLAGNVFTEAL